MIHTAHSCDDVATLTITEYTMSVKRLW